MIKHLLVSLVVSASAAPALAQQQKPEDHTAHHPAAAAAAASAAELTEGEVRKVDPGANKLTIKHGEIKNLDMPPMTMVFQVKQGVMLDKLKVGDKIRFAAEKAAAGYVVTEIRPAP